MKIVKSLLLALLFLICQTGNSQVNPEELTFQFGKYYYQNQVFSRQELGEVLRDDKEALQRFQFAMQTKKRARQAGIVALAGIVVALTSYRISTQSDNCPINNPSSFGCPSLTITIASGLITYAAIPLHLIMSIDGNIKRKKSVRIFNENLSELERVGKIPMQLDLKINAGQVGLVLNFGG